MSNTQKSYDDVAEEYVERIFNELEHKPFDRQLLGRFAAETKSEGLVCDMGCGPGQVARRLRMSWRYQVLGASRTGTGKCR